MSNEQKNSLLFVEIVMGILMVLCVFSAMIRPVVQEEYCTTETVNVPVEKAWIEERQKYVRYYILAGDEVFRVDRTVWARVDAAGEVTLRRYDCTAANTTYDVGWLTLYRSLVGVVHFDTIVEE